VAIRQEARQGLSDLFAVLICNTNIYLCCHRSLHYRKNLDSSITNDPKGGKFIALISAIAFCNYSVHLLTWFNRADQVERGLQGISPARGTREVKARSSAERRGRN